MSNFFKSGIVWTFSVLICVVVTMILYDMWRKDLDKQVKGFEEGSFVIRESVNK